MKVFGRFLVAFFGKKKRPKNAVISRVSAIAVAFSKSKKRPKKPYNGADSWHFLVKSRFFFQLLTRIEKDICVYVCVCVYTYLRVS